MPRAQPVPKGGWTAWSVWVRRPPDWQEGVVEALNAVASMGRGTVTFSDTDVSLMVPASVESDMFDTQVGALETRLPEAFSLDAVRLPPSDSELAVSESEAEFAARLVANGGVTLSGRLTDARTRDAVRSLAQANFGPNAVTMAARLDPDLPGGWPLRAASGGRCPELPEYGRCARHTGFGRDFGRLWAGGCV